jgi:predicted nucleotidyltransferase
MSENGTDKLSPKAIEAINRLAPKYGVHNVRVFGSVIRREAKPGSDLDLLVTMEPERSLLDLVGFWQDLEEALGHKVDVVTDEGLSPYLRDKILHEAVPL